MSQQTGTGQSMPLIRPEQIAGLPFIPEETKQQYKNGLANLWRLYEGSPAGSKEHNDALEKIRTASTKLMTMMSAGKGGNGNNRPGSGGGQQRPGSQQMTGQQQQQQGIAPQLAGAQNQNQPQGQRGPQQQGQAQAQRPGGQPGQGQPVWSPKQEHELQSINIVQPPNMPNVQWETYKTQMQNGLRDAIIKRDAHVSRYNALSGQVRQHEAAGKVIPDKAIQQVAECRKLAENAANNFRMIKMRAGGGDPNQAMAQAQAAQAQAQAQAQQQQRANAQQGQASQQQQAQSQQPDAKPVNRNSSSPQQYQNGFQQQAPNQQGQPAQQNMQQAPQQASPQPPQGFQQNLAQQQQQPPPQQQQQQPQQQHPNQQPRPPQINTQQIQPQHQQQQNTPGSAMPPSATQQNIRPPQPLTHSAAMSQAAEQYTRSQQQTQQQQQPAAQVAQAMPPFNANQAAGQHQQKDQGGYPNLQSTTSSTNPNSKFPIPRTLTLDPRMSTPVQGPNSRPSLYNAGMLTQPAMQRAPPYTLEGEGDRVLSKRKLDELVRQVTGAAPSSDNSESSSVLAPDVEESIMEVADNFVDEVITSACRLAKLRPNQTLDLRDVQMVLERNYGIRIPGYGLDETRIVRKFNPAPGWQNKMQAVQAGKVMGNRDS